MNESDLKMHVFGNVIGYQATQGGFFKQESSKCDAENPTAGPFQVHDKLPCFGQIWDSSM